MSDFTLGGRYGSAYLNGMHYSGSAILATPVTFPLATTGYKIIFYNRSGEKVGEITSEVEQSLLLNAKFELLVSGCGAFKIELSELPAELTDITYGYRVDIHLFGDSNPWYSGYIIELPQKGSTETTWEYSGYGFYNQLDDVFALKEYTNKQVSYIVKDIISTLIEPETDIVYNASRIQPTIYQVAKIRWDHVSVKEIMKQLSELVDGFDFGVDENRTFFFREKDTTVNSNAHWWAGKHLNTFIPKADISKVKNKLHIYGGEVTGGAGEETNYVITVEDLVSQALYGVKEDKLTLPSVLDAGDAEQWGNYKLTELAYHTQPAKITGIEVFKTRIEALGKTRVTSIDGLYEFELPIKRVKYNISSNGIEVDVELGEKDVAFTQEELKLKQQLATADALADQRTRQG